MSDYSDDDYEDEEDESESESEPESDLDEQDYEHLKAFRELGYQLQARETSSVPRHSFINLTRGRAVYTLQLYSLRSYLPPESGHTGFDLRPRSQAEQSPLNAQFLRHCFVVPLAGKNSCLGAHNMCLSRPKSSLSTTSPLLETEVGERWRDVCRWTSRGRYGRRCRRLERSGRR